MISGRKFSILFSPKFILIIAVLVSAYLAGVILFSPGKAGAVPVCFNSAANRNAARNATNSFPRTNISRNESGCGVTPNANQFVLLSSYYHNGSGAPGSTLHTPGASFRVMRSGAPGAAVRLTLYATGRCDWSAGNDVRLLVNGVERAVLDPQGTFIYDLPASGFVAASQFGTGMYAWNGNILVLATTSYGIHCRIRASVSAGNYIVAREDATPTTAHAEGSQRYNQANAGQGTGSKRVLGPPASGTNGAFALFSDLSGATLEYSIPMQLACNINTAQTVRIRYYDADSPVAGNATGTSQSIGNMSVAVYDETSGGLVRDTVLNGPNDGNDTYNEFALTMQPGRVYSVVWYNVQSNNGIQIWMPYSEITTRSGISCTPPYVNDTDPSLSSLTQCGTPPTYSVRLRVTSTDANGNNYNIQYRWTAGSTPWVNVARNADGYFYINAGTRGMTTTNTVYLRTNGTYPPNVNPSTVGNPDAAITVNFGPCYRDVQGTVYNAYNKGQRYAGLTINTCVTGVSATTNASGQFTFRVRNSSGYCVRIGGLPTGANSGRVRPYSEGYAACGGYTTGVHTPDYCASYSSYEYQYSGSDNTTGSYATYDRLSDTGFDFSVRFAPTASCAYTGGSPLIEVGTPFTPTMTVTNTGASTRPPASGTVTYTINGSSQNRNYGPLASGTSTNISFSPVTISTPGQYPHTVTVTVTGDGIAGASPPCTGINPSDPPTVGLYPYFKEYGGDVWSGGNITSGTDCSAPSNSPGNIYGFNRGSAGSFSGASANLTVTALMNINGYASASHRGAFTNTLPPKGLTFANNGASTYGGGYGANAARCITDYFTQTRDSSITQSGTFPPSTPTPAWSSGDQYVDSDGSVRHVNVPSAGIYTIRVRGTFHVHSATVFPESIVDAACWNRDLTNDGVIEPMGPISPPTFGLRANGNALTLSPANSGGSCASDHEYSGIINAPASGIDFSILDTTYADNSDQLIVELSRAASPAGWPAGRSQYVVSGDLSLGNTIIPRGSQTAVYVDGDVYIGNNIVFETGATSLAQIPNFALIVRGNIYIAGGVTRIDGLYVAQPDGSADSGTIYTCATAIRSACRSNNVFSQGSNQLSINGSFVAQRIKWLRARGTLRDSTPTETPNFGTGSGTNAAEVVNYTPQIWLAPSPLGIPGLSGGDTGRYDSIRSLPPIL